MGDALNILATLFGSILNVLNSITLFGTSLSVYIIAAFVASSVMKLVFDVSNSESKDKGGGE